MKTGEKIKYLRLKRGYTQKQLGEKIGVQKAAINKYESGRVINIKRSVLQSLAKELGVTPAQLLDDRDETNSPTGEIPAPEGGWTEEEIDKINEFKKYLIYCRYQ